MFELVYESDEYGMMPEEDEITFCKLVEIIGEKHMKTLLDRKFKALYYDVERID